MNKFRKKYYLGLISFLVFSFVSVNKVHAASLYISPSSPAVSVGNIVSLKVVVNTDNKFINNAEATIQFPTDMLEVVSVTKSSSIFSLWVEEPNFSNNSGKISFNGGVPNPGFSGSNGAVLSMTFKAKKQGTASVIFTDAAVRENDGLGTDILSSKSSSVVQIGVAKKTEIVESPVAPVNSVVKNSVPQKPIVVSETHPNQDLWYQNTTATFSWKAPNGIIAIQALTNKNPNSTPNINYDSSVSQKTLSNLTDGIYYFHIRYQNSVGWSPVEHFRIKIDSTPPLAFVPKVRTDDYKNIIKLEADDAGSGISHYTLKMDDDALLKVNVGELINDEYVLPVKKEGNHDIVVVAYDKAKNYREANTSFLSSEIEPPQLVLNTNEIIKGETVTISGTSKYPNKNVEITIGNYKGVGFSSFAGMFSPKENNKTYTQKISPDGTFSITTDPINTSGSLNVWGETIFSDDVKSSPSEISYLKVKDTKVVSTFLSLIYPLLSLIAVAVLVFVLLIVVYVGWHKFFSLRKRLRKDLENTAKEIKKASLLLKDELNNQLEILENVKKDRNLNKKEEAIFEELKKNIDDMEYFIEKKLKKLL